MAKKSRQNRPRRDTARVVSPFFLGIICLAVGCTRQIYVPVEHCVRDTVMMVRERIDTLLARDSVHIESRGDTTVKEVYRWRLKTRTRTDTVYKTRVDTISIPQKAVSPVKEKKQKTSLSHRIATTITWGTRAVMLTIAVVMLARWWRRQRRSRKYDE